MTSSFKKMTLAPPWKINFVKIVAKRQKQEVTKFGSHIVSGFRVAANTLEVSGIKIAP